MRLKVLRLRAASAAIRAHAKAKDGVVISDVIMETEIADLVSDLCHLAGAHGMNAPKLMERGINNWAYETETEEGAWESQQEVRK
jgi:hypothetical protein